MKDEKRLNYRCFRDQKSFKKKVFQQLNTSVFKHLDKLDKLI